MTPEFLILALAILFGFYVAWNIGANDVANAVGTAVGSGALTLKHAVILAALFEFAGAFFLGSNVTETIEGGIVKIDFFQHDLVLYIYGMLAALLATGVWLQTATMFGWPVSTTHSIVGAVLGFGLASGNLDAIYWGEMLSIVASWIVSPLLGGSLAFIIFTILRKKIFYNPRPLFATREMTPYLVFFMFFILSLIIFFGGLKNVHLELSFFEALLIAFLIAGLCSLVSYFCLRRVDEKIQIEKRTISPEFIIELKKAQKYLQRVEGKASGEFHAKVEELAQEVGELTKLAALEEGHSASEYHTVEKVFAYLQIITAAFMAFAHGSNDVANAIGPISAIFNLLGGKPLLSASSVPTWLLLLGAIGIVTGLATFGWKVIETIGRKITELTPSRGFAAGLAAAITIVLASKLGLPISTTHVVVGAVFGVGFARGIGALNLETIRDIVISWVVTVPVGAILSIGFFFAVRALFSLL